MQLQICGAYFDQIYIFQFFTIITFKHALLWITLCSSKRMIMCSHTFRIISFCHKICQAWFELARPIIIIKFFDITQTFVASCCQQFQQFRISGQFADRFKINLHQYYQLQWYSQMFPFQIFKLIIKHAIKFQIYNIFYKVIRMEKENSPYDSLTPAQLNTYQQLFSIFDKEDSGFIPLSSVPMFCRGIGHCPTEQQMSKILQDLGTPKQKSVSFKKLINVLEKRPKEQNIQQELLTAFTNIQSSFTSSSQASKSELMQINLIKKQLMDLGEPFNQSQLQAFTEFINNTNGLKVYEQEFNFRNLSRILAYAHVEN